MKRILLNTNSFRKLFEEDAVLWERVESASEIYVSPVWIAAQAIELGTQLVTYDRHFLEVPDLRVWEGLKGDF